jgi:hypothetical protein
VLKTGHIAIPLNISGNCKAPLTPAPWLSKTKYMNYKAGGKRFYAMVSPEGQEQWSIQEFTSIGPATNFKMTNAFYSQR